MPYAARISPNDDPRIAPLLRDLTVPLRASNKTSLLTEIADRIGPLSSPSKMPGYAWGISAKHCVTGSKLAKIPGTPCHMCYALRGRYVFANVQDAQERRLQGWIGDPDWHLLMSIAINLHRHKHEHFRWFDSGDLQSNSMLARIFDVSERTPDVKHWLPTQERGMLRTVLESREQPINLTIRVSSTRVDRVEPSTNLTSSVGGASNEQGIHICPSQSQGNKCGECRACWDRNVPHIRYLAH